MLCSVMMPSKNDGHFALRNQTVEIERDALASHLKAALHAAAAGFKGVVDLPEERLHDVPRGPERRKARGGADRARCVLENPHIRVQSPAARMRILGVGSRLLQADHA